MVLVREGPNERCDKAPVPHYTLRKGGESGRLGRSSPGGEQGVERLRSLKQQDVSVTE